MESAARVGRLTGMKRLTLWIAAFAFVPCVAAAEAWQAKNLKILSKTITKDQIKALMKKQADALGVDCDHCHAVPDMDKDTEHKEMARQMMRMVDDVNKKYFKGESKVACITCHRGKEKPEVK